MTTKAPLLVTIERDRLGIISRATITNDGQTRDITGQIDCITFHPGTPVGTLKWMDPSLPDDPATVEFKAGFRKRRRKPKSAQTQV